MAGQINDYKENYLSGKLNKDLSFFKELFKNDVIFRVKEIESNNGTYIKSALIYMDGMTDSMQINEAIIKPLITVDTANMGMCGSIADFIGKQMLFARDVKKVNNIAEILQGVLYGEALLLINGSKNALMMDVKGFRTRGIMEPQEERILQGPREGFEEAGLLNLAMLRRKLQTPDLCIELNRIGSRTNTAVFVCYLGALVNRKTLRKINESLKGIDIDGVLDVNYITEQISPHPFSIFKTSGLTERPDVVAARLLEGRIAIVVDGTPMVATIPYLFSENFQSDEDYYQTFWMGTLGRIMRYFCFGLSIILPALFVAITTLHPEFLPTSFLITVMTLRSAVPFSIVGETVGMILKLRILLLSLLTPLDRC